MSEKSLEEKIRDRQRQDMQDLAQQLGSTAVDSSPDAPLQPLSAAAEADSAAGAAEPKPKFFADVNMGKTKDGSGGKPEKELGIFARGKERVFQIFDKLKERWKKDETQFNEELFEEKQVEIFFQNIPENEREQYGYKELLARARSLDGSKGSLIEMKRQKREKFSNLLQTLGIKRDLVDDEEVKLLEADRDQEHAALLAIGSRLFAGDKQKLEKFLNQFDERDVKNRGADLELSYRAECGGLGDKVVAGLGKIGKKFHEMGFLKKTAITMIGGSAVVLGGATLGFGALGVSALGLGYRSLVSGLGGLSLGVGKRIKYEKERNIQEDMEKAERVEQRLQMIELNVDYAIDQIHKTASVGEVQSKGERQIFKDNRKAALWGVISAVLGRTAGEVLQWQGITFKNILEEIGIGSGGGIIKPSVSDHVPEVAKPSVVAEPEVKAGGSLPNPEPTKFSPETFEQVQKGFENANPDKHIDDVAKNLSKTFAGDLEPEIKSGGSLQNWAQTTHAAGAEVQTPEIAKPQFQEITSGEFGRGGSIEGKVMAAIEAKPEDFGLHQSDPDFATKALEMKKNIIEDFYKEKGFKSYAEFDRYCRKNVWDKDVFRIVHNPVTRDIILECKGHGFHDVFSTGDVPDVSPSGAGAAAQEVAPSKPNMPVDDARPRTGAADHHPARGGGKMKFSPNVEEKYMKADASAARALESRQYADNLKAQAPEIKHSYDLAHAEQVRATGRLLNRIFEGAGVSKWADVLNHPMKEWPDLFGSEFHISQDVQFNDATNKMNVNLDRLKELYPILRQYQTRGVETIGECLFKAMKDPLNVSKINEWVLTNSNR